jgi:hypothetical protein
MEKKPETILEELKLDPSAERYAAEPTKKKTWISRSWIGRHWRGEMRLAVSYWVIGFVGNFAVALVAFMLGTLFADYKPLIGFIGFSSMWGFTLLVIIWQLVGIWRSSNNHVGLGGKAFWSGAAKVMVIVGIFQSYGVFSSTAWPQIKEAYNIVAGDPRVGSFNMRLLNAGAELEIFGGIPFGSTAELRKFLDAAPTVRVIHLNSSGGRIGEAIKMRNLISDRGLSTITTTRCLSACTIVFLGGVERYLHPHEGQLGFHQGSFPGMDDEDFRPISERIISDAIRRGVAKEFIRKAYATASTSMWYPTKREALDAHYATAVSHGQFAISGLGGDQPNRETIASRLRKAPVYAAIELAEPDVFIKMSEIYSDGAIRGLPEGPVLSKMRGMMAALLGRYLPRASDDALVEMVKIVIEEMGAISKVDPIACHSFANPNPNNFIDIRRYADRDLQQRDLMATTNVLLSGMNRQAVIFSEKELEPLVEDLFQRIQANYGLNTLVKIGELGSGKQKQETCALTKIMYSEILKMPKIGALKLLRYMMSEGA